MATSSACPRCGAEPRDSARFCDACGTSLTPSAEVAEYKQVTVLFADVVRSMDIAAALGPERLREVMADVVDRSAAVVRRYGGTLNQFTGDGVMALFGAPKALEDHARRACFAALEMQVQMRSLAADVLRRDGLALQLRIGLDSGVVIAGDVGASSVAYTAMGEHVGMAQRMESVAPPGEVMLSRSTARLVEDDFVLGPDEMVLLKGFPDPVAARRLLSNVPERRTFRRESSLVGRTGELAGIAQIRDRCKHGLGALVTVSGPPGVGKTRLTREIVKTATERDFRVYSTYCESHTREVSFRVISRLLRAMFDVEDVSGVMARDRLRSTVHQADAEDMLLLDELLGIRDVDVELPHISPDARRRRLIDLITAVAADRDEPVVFVVEDAHWIDGVSESMLAEFACALGALRAMMLVTYRPEYSGPLSQVTNADSIVLAPLDGIQANQLLRELLGDDASVDELSTIIADRAAGIPFCVEEIVRDLAERGDIVGEPGAYIRVSDLHDVHVPATLQATIGARIDRLSATAKRTLNAAAVIGARFRAELLKRLLNSVDIAPLIDAQLVDQVGQGADSEYAFHHPLVQKVAYESQLKAMRSESHRRVAAILQQVESITAEEAAMIATQYEAAEDPEPAYEWYMRAATLYGARGIRAARRSWKSARRVADVQRHNPAESLRMQIAPRAMLCGSAFQVGGTPETTGFEELRHLTAEAGDKASLAVGMAGHISTLAFNSRHREAADMAVELAALVESIGDEEMTVGLLYGAAQAKWEAGEAVECLRMAQRIIDLARGDPAKGNLVIGSPLAWAITLRGAAKMFLGGAGWRDDIERGIAMAQSFDPTTRILAQVYKFAGATNVGAVLPTADDIAMTADSVEIARRIGDDTAVTYSLMNHANAHLHSPAGDGHLGAELLTKAREMLIREKLTVTLRRLADLLLARERTAAGDVDAAVDMARTVVDEQFDTGEMIFRGAATTALVEALLARRAVSDVDDAQAAVNRLAAVPTDPGFVLHDIPILRLRALLARACGDEPHYEWFRVSCCTAARRAGFDGFVAETEAMA